MRITGYFGYFPDQVMSEDKYPRIFSHAIKEILMSTLS